jgi:hypothetical protein
LIKNIILHIIAKIPIEWKFAWTRVQGVILLKPGSVERAAQYEFLFKAFKVLKFNGIDGDYAEFGCFSGVTFAFAYHIAKKLDIKTHFWAIDSFCGLPPQQTTADEHQKWVAGTMAIGIDKFHQACKARGLSIRDYSIIEGYYEECLSKLAESDQPVNISLAYVDCDLYSSTKAVLNFLRPRLKHGMIIAFDDYFCWSDTQSAGEKRALLEFLNENENWIFTPYLTFGWHGNSFVVEKNDSTGS